MCYAEDIRFSLTERQIEILRLLPNHSKKEIARILGISYSRVRDYQRLIYRAFGIKRGSKRTQAVMEGIRLEIIDLEKIEFPEMERFPWE